MFRTIGITRQTNGYYGDDKLLRFFTVVADHGQAVILANPIQGVVEPDFHEIIGAETLIIDRKRGLARLSRDFLMGTPDKTFYGMCAPVTP